MSGPQNHMAMAEAVRRNRPRGIWTPAEEAPLFLVNGWRLLDDGAGTGELLLQPPDHQPLMSIQRGQP